MLVNSVCYFTDNVVDQIEHSLQLNCLYVHLALLQIQKDSTLDLYDRIVLFSMFLFKCLSPYLDGPGFSRDGYVTQ